MRRFDDEDLTDAQFRECDLSRARLVGVVLQDVEIDGLVTHLVVNGVEVMPYVEAELDRRQPVRLLIRSADPADLREAWQQLRQAWATTTERARSMPEGSEHHGVDGEWSMVETTRHLVFVHDSWFRRCVLGLTEPFTAMGLASAFVPDQQELGLDRPRQHLRVVVGHHEHLLRPARSIPTIAFLVGTASRSRSSRALRLRSPRDTPLPLDTNVLLHAMGYQPDKVLARRTFGCQAWDLGVALDWAADRAARAGFPGVTVACEPTGHRWRVLGQLAADRGMPFVCVQPMLSSWARKSEDLTCDKTDDKDAVLIARLTAQLRCYLPEPG